MGSNLQINIMTTKHSASSSSIKPKHETAKNQDKSETSNNQQHQALLETVDLNQLTVPGLKRYKRVFKLQVKSNARPDLANAVNSHFEKQEVEEDKTIYNFIYMVKNKKSKLHNSEN